MAPPSPRLQQRRGARRSSSSRYFFVCVVRLLRIVPQTLPLLAARASSSGTESIIAIAAN